ncbi:hypothetical protein T484DRAFT_1750300 [Baffinella frigidus]|nr:hypothetical protein T484DRAFT_1750300 [Cryptophyta sp. CCMP2293]
MVHSPQNKLDAFERDHTPPPRSGGCAAAFLPFMRLKTSTWSEFKKWFTNRKEDKTVAGRAPFLYKIGSGAPVQLPLLDAHEAWDELARRFHNAHVPATRTMSQGDLGLKGPGNAARAQRGLSETNGASSRPATAKRVSSI